MRKALILIFLVVVANAYTQNFDEYEPLKSSGKLPEDFTTRTSVKVAKDISTEIKSTEKTKVKKSKSEFLLKSNYMIDELLMSGRVLFGDQVSEYVNKVADRILASEPELRSKLRFYCVKSNVTNAFTTNQGMIFVTLGLISQLENEAQLAYVLGHEVVHFKNKHVINSYLESDRILGQRGRYKYNNYDDNIVRLSNYSKTLEFESDSLGFSYLEEAGYDIKAAMSVFDVLQFSYLPYDEVEVDLSFIESENFEIPDKYKLDSIVPINFEGDYDDSKSSHPNVDKRREKVKSYIKNSDSKENNQYIVSTKEEFVKVRNICRFEAIRLNLKDREYVKAFYNSQILQAEFPNSNFLKKSIAKSLYGIFQYKAKRKYYSIIEDYDDYEGNISATYFLFEEMNVSQVGSIAVRYMWQLYSYNKDEYVKKMMDDVIRVLMVEENVKFDEYKSIDDILKYKEKLRQDSLENLKVDSEHLVDNEIEEQEVLSKYEKLRKIKEEQEEEVIEDVVEGEDLTDAFYLLAFVDINEREKLNKEFNHVHNLLEEEKKKKEEEEKKYAHLSEYQKRKAIYKDEKNSSKDELKVGVEKVVFVDPEYFEVDERKGLKLVDSEDSKFDFYGQIEKVSKAANLDVEILSAKLFTPSDVDLYNDISAYNDWVGERMDHDESVDGWGIIPSETEYVKDIAEKKGTNFVSYSGVLLYKNKKNNKGAVLLITALYYPLFPFGVVYALTPSYYTYYYTFVYDINTGERVVEKVYDTNIKANKGNINSFMYDLMVQMKQKKGE